MKAPLKIKSKKLPSGMCQVRFEMAAGDNRPACYGYCLAEPHRTVESVVREIFGYFENGDRAFIQRNRHLFSLETRSKPDIFPLIYLS